MKKKNIFLIILLFLILLTLFLVSYKLNLFSNKIEKKQDESSNDGVNYVELNSSYEITSGGTYSLSGTISDGLITINTKEEVYIILNNVNITNTNGPCIYVLNSKKTTIELKEGTTNTLIDGSSYTGYDTKVNSLIYSKDDLIIDGEGTLNITSNYQDAIASKDDIIINNGIINITSNNDGIRGKDSVTINGGTITINSGGKGIKSTNTEKEDKGVITINDGVINITSKDDSLHSSNIININGGKLTLSSDDDGIHSDKSLVIKSGDINITKSYEGLEAYNITIDGGTIKLVSSDDGVNICDEKTDDTSSNNSMGGMMDEDNGGMLTINGGTLYVNAEGDGLDSNGSITMSGGEVYVDGPTNGGNGALDYNGTFNITGGNIIAIGSSGMAQGLSSSSSQYSVEINLTNSYNKDTKIEIKDSSDNTIMSYTSNKTFGSIVYSSNKLTKGETYKVYINDKEYTSFTIQNIVTTIGSQSNTPGGNPGGMMGDFRR